MRPRAVIFDLWETLIDWDREAAAAMVAAVSEHAPDFASRWSSSHNRYTGPIRVALTDAGVPVAVLEEVCALRLDYVRVALVPRPGAVETLRRLRELGILVGLITVCSEDVEVLWPSSAFAGLFDAEVFSSSVGLSKPDPRIYLRCCELLGVEPGDAVFVGDGANDELAGAERVGMRAILIHRAGKEPYWDGLADFAGPRVTSIPQVLEVLELC
ncbi:MAG TPA: HAD-IA family hydrolase [Gaiellaceae bacterium]